jgi:hypothetical protein
MATNLNVYVPNIGEKEQLKAILLQKAMVLGLYKNQIIPDGNTVIDTLTEMATGGGRGYAQKELSNEIVENAPAANKWYVTTDAQGKALGSYHNAVLTWLFNTADVADAPTVYGVFAYCWVMPFSGGVTEIKVGDTVIGHTSGATGIVTGVCPQSGTWAGGDAAGYLDIKAKTGTYQNAEELWVSGAKVAVSNPGVTGDAHKRLLAVWAFPAGVAITQEGQQVTWDMKYAVSSGT